jgi:hypothetical protein
MTKILFWDIESIPYLSYVWDFRRDNGPGVHMLVEDKAIVTIAYKWAHEKKAHVLSLADNPKRFKKDIRDDSDLVAKFREVMAQADLTVAHFGDKFDLRYFNGRLLKHGLDPLPDIKSYDTWKAARKKFLLASNKLDHLGTILGVGNKNSMSWSDWEAILKGDIKALKKMADYNIQDVILLEAVYNRLRAFDPPKINVAHHAGMVGCPTCGSEDLMKNGFKITASGRFQRFHCKSCGAWSYGKKNMLTSPEVK